MALTPEQQKQVRVARRMLRNMWQAHLPMVKEYAEVQQKLLAWNPRPRPTEPEETPEERARMTALLAEIAQQKETK